jgi:hypothetical protein
MRDHDSGEAHEEMPTDSDGNGSSGSGDLLFRSAMLGQPKYPIALDLIGMIIGRYAAEIRKQEDRSQPDELLIRRFKDEKASYYQQQAELQGLDDIRLAEAIARYRQVLRQMRSYRDDVPT